MSDIEHHRGKAFLLGKGDMKELAEIATKILESKGLKVDDYYDNAVECLCDNLYVQYFYHPNSQSLFKIEDTEVEDEYEIIRAKEIEKDTYEYELKFYNGGAGFSECLEEAFDKL